MRAKTTVLNQSVMPSARPAMLATEPLFSGAPPCKACDFSLLIAVAIHAPADPNNNQCDSLPMFRGFLFDDVMP
jgi:hypothetical protein